MAFNFEVIRERARAITANPRTLGAVSATILVALLAVGYFTYTLLLRPVVSDVHPCPPECPPPFVQGEFLVKFKPGSAADAVRNLNAENQATDIDSIRALGVTRMRVPTGSSVGEKVNAYKRNPNVQYAEPNFLATEEDIPNDPGFSTVQWNLTKVQAPQAWDISKGSRSVPIAIIDSGILPSHEDFSGKLLAGFNFVDGNTTLTDTTGHGSIVAGSAGVNTNNGVGIAGLARENPLMPLQVTDSTGSASYYNISQAIVFAADNGAKVINISLGGVAESSLVTDAVTYAWGKGLVIVAAAGNNGTTGILYPAAQSPVLGVGATNIDDVRANFSNMGPQLGVVAPGVQIYSTNRSGAYDAYSGTSYAAPQVAALAALIMSANSNLSNQQVVDLIKSTADPLGGSVPNDQYGHGRINALKALQKATGATAQAATATPAAAAATATLPPPTATSAPSTATPAPVPATATPLPPTPTAAPTTPSAAATATPITALASSTAKTESFTGTVSASGTKQANHSINVTAAGPITASLNWGGNPDLDLFLLNSLNQEVAAATKSGKPADISFSAPAAGTYTLRVVAIRGNNASYTLSTTHP